MGMMVNMNAPIDFPTVAVGPRTNREGICVAREDRRRIADVLGGGTIHQHTLAGLELPDVAHGRQVDDVAPEAVHGGLEGSAGPKGAAEEQASDCAPGEIVASASALNVGGEFQDVPKEGIVEVAKS